MTAVDNIMAPNFSSSDGEYLTEDITLFAMFPNDICISVTDPHLSLLNVTAIKCLSPVLTSLTYQQCRSVSGRGRRHFCPHLHVWVGLKYEITYSAVSVTECTYSEGQRGRGGPPSE